jgi:catechol 2,3-dioxygenase-like lactoylglutathione lyase family enzyme
MENVNPPPQTRHRPPAHPFGLTGMDHAALAVHDVERAVAFYQEVLGGTVYYATGFGEVGRVPHVFLHVGTVLLQVGHPNDGRSFADPESQSHWPHVAFGADAPTLERMCEHLSGHRVPFSGPRSHLNVDAVSIYFKDPDHNKLEICTWDPYPMERTELLGPPPQGKGLDWQALSHDWRPAVGAPST